LYLFFTRGLLCRRPHLTTILPFYSILQGFRADFAAVATTITSLDSSILVAKIDADTDTDIGTRFSIDGYPTFRWFEDGEAISDFSDELSKELLLEWVKKLSKGSSDEITSMKQAEELLSTKSEKYTPAPIVVLGYFKNGFEDGKNEEYKAFKKRKNTYAYLLYFLLSLTVKLMYY
jgi:hypothetical protein